MNLPVNITTDIVLEGAVHPAPIPPVPNASVAGTVQGHLPGIWTHTAKLTRGVTHKGHPLVQQRHDCGAMIPHVTLPLYSNPWYAVIMPTSSCKVLFGASTVKANGKSMGMAGIGQGITLPMMTCGYPSSMPTAIPISTFNNTVNAKMLPLDLLAGCLSMALKIISDAIVGRLFPTTPRPAGATASQVLKRIAKELFPALPTTPKKFGKFLLKQGLAAASRFTVTAAQKDNPTLQISEGRALGKVKLKLKRQGGEWETGVEVHLVGGRYKDGKVSLLGEELR